MTTKLRAETARLLEAHPHLHIGGYGGTFDDSDRAVLLTPAAQVFIAGLGVWISCNLIKSVRVNHRATLGRLRWLAMHEQGGPVAPGALICAMLLAGFNAESLSCRPCFNVTRRSLADLAEQQRGKRCQTSKRLALYATACENGHTDLTSKRLALRLGRSLFQPAEVT